MMPFSNGFLLSLSLCLDIGIANIAMMTLAMQRGYFHGFWLGIGTCIGDLIYAVLALAGMTILLQYQSVRWVLWVGGSLMLMWFTYKMIRAALAPAEDLQTGDNAQPRSVIRNFGRGVLLAMSSPTAILWFAAVGGALISRMGQGGPVVASWFLSGFFIAGVFWTVVICSVGSLGGKMLGTKMLKYSYVASAVIFSYFALYVVITGYREFIV
ncbi:LysE family translocator [Rahnella victoriana]|uniref:LysE family transporter n=1 Tax=Rahnella victoriana TaxID=1510570 RepID=A0ABS0DM08_9GAMM|nr:LysE family transporter [Rahnella victoriana]PKB90590.1 lysine transporter LysE [Ewingella americana]MBF7954403.1 LysE family transporter [Rahnella victoriana]PBI81918.1 lysine transporter LysE [Rahnella victoriana]TBX31404.1 LysE family translocator [Rahnella victoriana]UHM91461.1 LysE family translocator [Rahnella victoriana]